jgi:hypothetical protein
MIPRGFSEMHLAFAHLGKLLKLQTSSPPSERTRQVNHSQRYASERTFQLGGQWGVSCSPTASHH